MSGLRRARPCGSAARTPARPPHTSRSAPLSRASGATPTSAAICLRFRLPSSETRFAAAVGGPGIGNQPDRQRHAGAAAAPGSAASPDRRRHAGGQRDRGVAALRQPGAIYRATGGARRRSRGPSHSRGRSRHAGDQRRQPGSRSVRCARLTRHPAPRDPAPRIWRGHPLLPRLPSPASKGRWRSPRCCGAAPTCA